ncbi:MAG: dicarboxylate/amino acid:cation symporter [Lachnospirales bacterium]
MANGKKLGITALTLIGLCLGIITGIIFYALPENYFLDTFLVEGVFYVLGNGFIKLLKMIVVPLVFVSLVSGTMAIGDVKKLGKIGVKTVAFYLATTTLAIVVALTVANVIKPGIGLDMANLTVADVTVAEKTPLTTTFLNLIPDNPIGAMANGDMIPIIVFAIFVGVGILTIGSEGDVVSKFFIQFNEVMLKITLMVMKVAPIGVFALVARTFANLGFSAFSSLIKYMASVLLGLGIQAIIVYSLMLFIFTKLNPLKFIRKFVPIATFAFSTASSNATIPVSIDTLEKNMGISRKISSFTIPLGATINMDGTAIMQGVAVVFTAQAFGIVLTGGDYLTVILTATLASIGTAGVPGVGLVMLSMVLTSIGLPVEAIGIIMGIDRILDMTRTAVNVMGDAVCTTIVAMKENDIDLEIYNS